MLFKRLYFVENDSWVYVHLSSLFQPWQNNVETTSTELRWFNVDEQMLFQLWNLVENKSWADVWLSMLFQRWQCWNKIERITPIQCWWSNIASTLMFGWKGKFSQRMLIDVASMLRKQHWNNFVNICCTDVY